MKPFVTLSASFGAGGGEVGPALAARLGVAFFDRAIPVQVAEALGTSTDNPLLQEERPSGFWGRLLAGIYPTGAVYGANLPVPAAVSEGDYRAAVDRVIAAAADGAAGGVLLGRAGAVVLAGHPRTLHVRLDGPQPRRIQRIRDELGVDEEQASEQLRRNDAAREAYVKRLYRVDAKDPVLYDLIIDSTSIPLPVCVELIVVAANAHRARPSAEARLAVAVTELTPGQRVTAPRAVGVRGEGVYVGRDPDRVGETSGGPHGRTEQGWVHFDDGTTAAVPLQSIEPIVAAAR